MGWPQHLLGRPRHVSRRGGRCHRRGVSRRGDTRGRARPQRDRLGGELSPPAKRAQHRRRAALADRARDQRAPTRCCSRPRAGSSRPTARCPPTGAPTSRTPTCGPGSARPVTSSPTAIASRRASSPISSIGVAPISERRPSTSTTCTTRRCSSPRWTGPPSSGACGRPFSSSRRRWATARSAATAPRPGTAIVSPRRRGTTCHSPSSSASRARSRAIGTTSASSSSPTTSR